MRNTQTSSSPNNTDELTYRKDALEEIVKEYQHPKESLDLEGLKDYIDISNEYLLLRIEIIEKGVKR